MLPMLGASLLGKLLPFKDGGAIPPSNAMMRMRPAPIPKMYGGAVARKHGGAVKKRKSKPKKKCR